MTQDDAWAAFSALGSTAVVASADPAGLALARAAVEETVAAFDRACSRFREDSELCAVNAAAGSAVSVSPLLLEALAAALRAAELTDGDVDPTVGEALIALGYDRDFGSIGGGTVSVASVPGWRTVRVDPQAGTVKLARGVKLDLGATAKALAADRAAAAAAARAGCGVLVSLGGDISIAGPPPPDGWRVRVTDDHRSGFDAPGQWITVRSGGLATSSTTVRRWQAEAGSAHHVVDPASGRSATVVWRTVSVTAASCLDANIASTAAIVRGARAARWLEEVRLPSRLVGVDGRALYVAGWPPEGDDLPRAAGFDGPRALGLEGSRALGVEGSRALGVEGSRGAGVEGSRGAGVEGSRGAGVDRA
jgi:thiamine biosynthesis lipoprotein